MDPEEACVAGEPLRVGWLDGALRESFWQTEEDSHEEQEYKFAAAREMVLDLAPPGIAGPGERMIAVHFVSVHAAATGWQARAISRYLPEAARETAQRFACRLVDITVRLLGALERSAAERRKAQDEAERRALDRALRAREAEQERARAVPPAVLPERYRGLDDDLEDERDDEPADDLDSDLDDDADGLARGKSIAQAERIPSETSFAPAVATAAVPAPLNRRQRRAMARRLRKAGTGKEPPGS